MITPVNTVKCYKDPLALDVTVRVRDQWVSDPAYLEMVQKTVICCTDSTLTVRGDPHAIYLAKRTACPMAGVWCLGGRVFFNDDSPEVSIARCVKLETGVSLDPKRFVYLRTNLYSWVKVAQGDFGGKNFAATYNVEVSSEELTQMAHGLKKEEYDPVFGFQRFCRERLVDESVHPAMLDIYDQLWTK